MNRILIIISFAFICIGCAVPLNIPRVELNTITMERPVMDFIGIKNPGQTYMFTTFGEEIERSQIANNKQSYYQGDYALDDLSLYESHMRYITFVERVKSSFGHNSATVEKKDGTNLVYDGIFTIYIYDTKERKIIWNKTVVVQESDYYIGTYYHENTDFKAIDLHYQNVVYNALLAKYVEGYNYIKALQQ